MLSSPPPKLTHTRSAEQETRGLQRPRARCDGPLALTCQEAFSFILSIFLSSFLPLLSISLSTFPHLNIKTQFRCASFSLKWLTSTTRASMESPPFNVFVLWTFPQRWWGSCVVLSATCGAQHASHCFATVSSVSVFPKHCVSCRWTQIQDTPLAKHFLTSMKTFSCVFRRLFLQCKIHNLSISVSFTFYILFVLFFSFLKMRGLCDIYLSLCRFVC